jgi:hypothetical protein
MLRAPRAFSRGRKLERSAPARGPGSGLGHLPRSTSTSPNSCFPQSRTVIPVFVLHIGCSPAQHPRMATNRLDGNSILRTPAFGAAECSRNHSAQPPAASAPDLAITSAFGHASLTVCALGQPVATLPQLQEQRPQRVAARCPRKGRWRLSRRAGPSSWCR